MNLREAVVGISALTATTGVALLGIAVTSGSVAWLLAELPGAQNSIVPELVLAGLGCAFLVLALLGLVVGAARSRAADRAVRPRTAAVVTGGVLAVLALVVAVQGAATSTSQAVAVQVASVGPDHALLGELGAPVVDGRALVLVALVLAVAAFAVLLVPRPAPAGPAGPRTSEVPQGSVSAG